MESLPDEVLAKILYRAAAPVAWPWCTELRTVCRQWNDLCVRHQGRGWYLAHSTLQRRE